MSDMHPVLKLSSRDIAEIRRRHWAEKARQEREEITRVATTETAPWFHRIYPEKYGSY